MNETARLKDLTVNGCDAAASIDKKSGMEDAWINEDT